MGNICFCNNINFIKDVKLNACFNKQAINHKSDQILIRDENKTNSKERSKVKEKGKDKSKNKMDEILNYFNEGEKEIMNNLKKNAKAKHISTKKRTDHANDNKEDNKYELMLKRLLEQQNIKKVGPKRRGTIHKDEGEKIKEIVKNLLIENKNDILKNKNEDDQNNSLLIKKEFNKKGRFSVSIDRNTLFMNSLNNNKKKKFREQYLKNRNTMYEVIVESNGDGDLDNNPNSNISK